MSKVYVEDTSIAGRRAEIDIKVDRIIRLLEAQLTNVVASDGHSPYQRTPTLHEVYEYIAERFSRAYADSLLRETPRRIVSNV